MVFSSILSHLEYNSLPPIEAQAPPSEDVLASIGRIFVNHGLQSTFGVALLHRHFELAEDEVMVHQALRCSPMTPASNLNLSGNALCLRNGAFQAFEYEIADPIAVDHSFLRDLKDSFLQHGLENQLALSKLDMEYPRLMEHCAADRTHVCEVVNEDILSHEATEWRFDVNAGATIPVRVRGCARTSSNDHKTK